MSDSIQLAHPLAMLKVGHVDALIAAMYIDKDVLVIEARLEFIRPNLSAFSTPPVFRQRLPLSKLRRESRRWHKAVDDKIELDAKAKRAVPQVVGL